MTEILVTEAMLSSGRPIAQGEVLIWLRRYAPPAVLARFAALRDVIELVAVDGRLILGHSETGHHHVLEPVDRDVPPSRAARALIDATNDTLVELRIASTCRLVHLRSFDTHATIVLPPGDYVRAIREEQIAVGWARVSD